jgi:hypothetical protein
MSHNRAIAEAFAAQFDPPLNPVQTARINNMPVRDAWLVAVYDKQTGYGITAHAYAGQLHAFLEGAAESDGAADIGRVLAATMRKLRDGPHTDTAPSGEIAGRPQAAEQRPPEGHAEQGNEQGSP